MHLGMHSAVTKHHCFDIHYSQSLESIEVVAVVPLTELWLAHPCTTPECIVTFLAYIRLDAPTDARIEARIRWICGRNHCRDHGTMLATGF